MKTDLYKMTYKNKKIKRKYKLNILGNNFVKNNKNKGKYIYNNKKYALNDILIIDNRKNINNNEKIKIKIVLDDNCTNKSCMFANCNSLLTISIDTNQLNFKSDDIKKENQIYNETEIHTVKTFSRYF